MGLRCAVHKGSDVRMSVGTLNDPRGWPRRSYEAGRWRWRIIFAYGARDSHINVGELRAVLTSVRWRCRQVHCIHKRSLHLCDSQVAIGVFVKGRSSSHVLSYVIHRLNCLQLDGGLVSDYTFVRTDHNPADKPSRWSSVGSKSAAASRAKSRGRNGSGSVR